MLSKRAGGVLLHPTSLPGDYGIGDLGPECLHFINWLAEAGQNLWQVLPLGPTGYGDSPYAPFSSFAGNELLLSPELLAKAGLLTDAEKDAARLPATARVDFGTAIATRKPLVRLASRRYIESSGTSAEFSVFKTEQAAWLDDYVLFMDIKEEYDARAIAEGVEDSSWNQWWPPALAGRNPAALEARRTEHAGRLEERRAAQFLFHQQWHAVRQAANSAGIRIIGDLPIFVAMDSADAWAHPELFMLDEKGKPLEVAGVPPDYFSETGQLWGNPLYRWQKHQETGFSWWTSRMQAILSLYDIVRIDHFRGLQAFWAVPAGEKTAEHGTWKKAPGKELLGALKAALGGNIPVIAEDLGFITDEVRALRDDFQLPGMRILQFGFDASESGKGLDPHNPFLPHNYTAASVAYTGTHDNDTMAGWLAQASSEERRFLEAYLGHIPDNPVWAVIREIYKSVAAFAVVPMQDMLGLGPEARMNEPGTIGNNWAWRMQPGAASQSLARDLRQLAVMYARTDR
ncbi:MAG: 4-alpha-glucanotransferase [Clostridia bacterium]|jgi:4-alpha-glucanotransferase|nr:4-alpha-glucanotransferase [Spirochaetia bacterium]